MELVLTKLPEEIVHIFENNNKLKNNGKESCSPLDGVSEGARNDVCFKYACKLVGTTNLSKEEISNLVSKKAMNCKPPLEDSEVHAIINSAHTYKEDIEPLPDYMDAHELLHADIPEPEFIIPGILPTGLTIFAGKPKQGKSWLALDIALKLSIGEKILNKIPLEQGKAIVLALEDTQYRLQSRMKMLLKEGGLMPGQLHLYTSFPQGGFEELRAIVGATSGVRLLVIDTLARIRGAGKSKTTDSYAKDYEDIANLKKIADEFGIAVLVVHHVRKAFSSDPFETISGTNGITGAADSMWVLKKDDGTVGNLFIRGRDIEEQTMNLQFDNGIWSLTGHFEIPPNALETQIIELLIDESLTPKQISKEIGKDVSKVLQRMVQKGHLIKTGHGKYNANSLASML